MGMLVNPYRHGAAFNPASLFTGGETGDYWRFDAANTDANVATDPIGTATGVVNGRTLVQATAVNKPTLTTVSGREAASFDASGANDDWLIHSFGSTVSQPATLIVCLGDTSTLTHVIATGSSTTSRMQLSVDGSNNVIIYAGSTLDSTNNAPIGTKVITGIFDGASSKTRYNGTQTATGNAGTQSTNQLTVGALWDGTFAGTNVIYSLLFINRLLTSDELNNAERYLGAHAGLSW